MTPRVAKHRAVQQLAKSALDRLGGSITPLDTEASIAERLVAWLAELDITETWYHDCPALVLLGSRSCLSISGRDYVPADEPVGLFNLVTVDLSPMLNGNWGDCARSFALENGRHVAHPTQPELARGLDFVQQLHQRVREVASPNMTCDELFTFVNELIHKQDFENLDFLRNIGHSIESRRERRRFMERGNATTLGELQLFTFEPHVRQRGGRWGFKLEEIYYFTPDGTIDAL